MTLIVRRVGPVKNYRKLGRAKACRCGLGEIVGSFGRGPIKRVVWLDE